MPKGKITWNIILAKQLCPQFLQISKKIEQWQEQLGQCLGQLFVLCAVALVISYSLRPYGCSLPGCSVHGILCARIVEQVAIPPPGDLARDRTRVSQVSCIGRQVLYCQHHLGSPSRLAIATKMINNKEAQNTAV